MKGKMMALLLALALGSVIAMSAFATETAVIAGVNAEKTEQTPAEAAEDSASTEEPVEKILDDEPVIEIEEASPNMIMFAELADLVKKNSPAYKAAQASAGAIDDAQSTVDQMKARLAQIGMELDAIDANTALSDAEKQAQKAPRLAEQKQLESGISSLSSFSGQSSAQASAGGYQVIMGCESIYIALVELELQEAALLRTLESLDRTLAELKIRAEWGQVSQLQLMETESGREELVSGLTTLRMNMTNLKMQLESLLGEKITGTAEVGVLPRVTSEQLETIDLEADLKMVLRRNPDIQAAEDKESSLYSAGMSALGDVWDGMSDAAGFSVKNAKLQAEMKFRSLYAELMDCCQIVAAKRNALEVEQLTYEAAELKYAQGTISKNVLLTAADDLQSAKEAVVAAENSLFSTYNQYNWAVKHGLFM